MILVSAFTFVFPSPEDLLDVGPEEFEFEMTEEKFNAELSSRKPLFGYSEVALCIEGEFIIQEQICKQFPYNYHSRYTKGLCKEKPKCNIHLIEGKYEVKEIFGSFLSRFWDIASSSPSVESNYRHNEIVQLRKAYKRFSYSVTADVVARKIQNLTQSRLSFDVSASKMYGFLMHAYFWVNDFYVNCHDDDQFMFRYTRLKNSRLSESTVSNPTLQFRKKTIIQCFNKDGTFPFVEKLEDVKKIVTRPQFLTLVNTPQADLPSVCGRILTDLKENCTIGSVSYDGCCLLCAEEFRQVIAVSKCKHVVCDTCVKQLAKCPLCNDANPSFEHLNVKRLKLEDGTYK